MNEINNLVIEIRETQKFVKTLAASNKAMACMQYLDKLLENGLITEEDYRIDLIDIGKNLLQYRF